MLGQMMQMPLLISSAIQHAEKYHGSTEISSVETAGGIHKTTWSEVSQRSRQLADALDKNGFATGTCCATMAWNNHRHLEVYFGVSGGGRICHTINPRLFPAQLSYIIDHASDKVLFFDKTFLPLVLALKDKLESVEMYILMSGRDEAALEQFPDLVFYEEFIATGDADYEWPVLDENEASSLCYTSGTTGDPKGVLYSHRSTMLHSFCIALPDSMNLSATDSLMPVVPMFHVNAWGVPYAAAMVGSKLALPGPGMDGDSLLQLIDDEKVTLALGVPTIWQGLISALEKSDSKMDSLTRTVVGGAACPPSMMETFRSYGVDTIHAWGMTELSPVGAINTLLSKHNKLSEEDQQAIRLSQGRPPFGIELRLMDDNGVLIENDGETQGNLECRGHWVVDTYFNASSPAHDDGWFATGDVSTIDGDGYMTIRDRSKDIIKSGGEWISTVELEGVVMAHPDVANAAVIGAKHEKWDERPLLIVVKKPDTDPTSEELLRFFEGKIAKWQIPDEVIFVDELPLTGTGKLLKNKLRDSFGDYLLKK